MQSVTLLERLKDDSFAQPVDVRGIVALIDQGETRLLSWHRRVNEEHLKLCIAEILIDMFEFYGSDPKQAMMYMRVLLPRMISRFYHLTPEDIRLFVERACCGEYGKCYGALTPSVVMEWLGMYSANRFSEIESAEVSRHNMLKERCDNLTSERASEELNSMLSKKISVDDTISSRKP